MEQKSVDFAGKTVPRRLDYLFGEYIYSISKKTKSGCYLLEFYRLFGSEIASYF